VLEISSLEDQASAKLRKRELGLLETGMLVDINHGAKLEQRVEFIRPN
jgi:hypothetical protein